MFLPMLGYGPFEIADDATIADLKDAIAARRGVPRATLCVYLDGRWVADGQRVKTLVLRPASGLVAKDESQRCSHGSFSNALNGGYECGNC